MKKGKIIPKGGTKPSAARCVRLKVMIPVEDYERGLPYFGSRKNLNRYVVESFRERVNRSAANDKTARLRTLMGNIEILEQVLKEMYAQGKLNFLFKDL
jgi:hypothetical protein